MSENTDRYRRALDGFGAVVAATPRDRWDDPSPCTEWSARDVAGHLIAVVHAIVATIDGRRAPMHPMRDPGRHAGEDPASVWSKAVDAFVAAVADPNVVNRIVPTWRGEVTVDDMIGYGVADVTIHTWDLARAVGGDDRLDPDLVEASIRELEPLVDSMRERNAVGAAIAVADDAVAQERLLALMGRAS